MKKKRKNYILSPSSWILFPDFSMTRSILGAEAIHVPVGALADRFPAFFIM
ncbi:MAG: hypothetical protein ACFFCS_28820 [Candidatus Hodarchaeota archaeon]